MPRVTKSKSYSYKLFGVRHTVRRTTSSGSARSGGPHVQIHLSGKDYMELQRQHQEAVTTLMQEATERHKEAMRNLNPIALRLHTIPGGIAALVVLGVATLYGITTTNASVGLMPAYVIAVALAAVDWHNFTTLHGKINWPLFKFTKSAGLYWFAVICYALFCMFPGIVYLMQCLQTSGQVREIQREKLQEDIARLEYELSPQIPSTDSPTP